MMIHVFEHAYFNLVKYGQEAVKRASKFIRKNLVERVVIHCAPGNMIRSWDPVFETWN
jgi:protein-tyrosine phosphatase